MATLAMPAEAKLVQVVNIATVGPSRTMDINFHGFDGVVQAVAQRLTTSDGFFFDVFCSTPEDRALLGAVNLTFDVTSLSDYSGSLSNVNAAAGFARWGLTEIGAKSPVGQFGVTFYGNGASVNPDHASTAALIADAQAAIAQIVAQGPAYRSPVGVFYWRSLNGQGQDYLSITSPAVPEPSTWAMMFVGFGAIGCTARRRTKLVTISA